MMQQPTLSEGQFAVLMADGATGHVLNTEGDVYRSDEKEVFFLFDNLQAAREFVEVKQNEKDTVEFCIYDSNHNLLAYLEARKWKR